MIRSLLTLAFASQLMGAEPPCSNCEKEKANIKLTTPAHVKGIDISLISDVASVAPGESFRVGFYIRHHEGYHTYWKNPGIVGLPITTEWEKPEGVEISGMTWAMPQKMMMSIHPAHGFKRDVLHFVTVTVPKDFKAKTLTLKSEANWMACAVKCHPTRANFSITLPVTTEKPAKHSQHWTSFEKTVKEQPLAIKGWTVSIIKSADSAFSTIRLVPDKGNKHQPKDIYFFSTDGQITSKPEPTVKHLPEGIIEITAPNSEFIPKNLKKQENSLPGILYSSNGWGKNQSQYVKVNPKK